MNEIRGSKNTEVSQNRFLKLFEEEVHEAESINPVSVPDCPINPGCYNQKPDGTCSALKCKYVSKLH